LDRAAGAEIVLDDDLENSQRFFYHLHTQSPKNHLKNNILQSQLQKSELSRGKSLKC
jgi:hypothetical protein